MFVDTNVLVYAHDASEILRQPAVASCAGHALARPHRDLQTGRRLAGVLIDNPSRAYLVIVGPASDTRRTR